MELQEVGKNMENGAESATEIECTTTCREPYFLLAIPEEEVDSKVELLFRPRIVFDTDPTIPSRVWEIGSPGYFLYRV